MPHAVLISQCLQHDFVHPLGRFEPLPTTLHIGHAEARRLMGEEPAAGPVARLMRWAYAQPAEHLAIIHIRDWHDPADRAQDGHLQHFGAHCLAGSPGARFVFEDDPELPAGRPVSVVDASGLNDFVDTTLAALLAPWAQQALTVGLIGVWTEAKVSYLAYELATRYPRWRLTTCSALTASATRPGHFQALEQLERLLGLRVEATLAGFIAGLRGSAAGSDGEAAPLIGYQPARPSLAWAARPAPAVTLAEPDQVLTRYVFRDCRAITLRPLAGGFSGNLVLAVDALDNEGRQRAPHVLKLGPAEPIARERMAFERIEPVLGNAAPAVVDFAEHGGRAAIVYRYASMGGGATTFKRLWQDGAAPAEVERVLRIVFEEQLGRLYAAAQRDPLDLLAYYGFSARWAPDIRARVAALLGPEAAAAPRVEVSPGVHVDNPCRFYEALTRPAAPRVRYPYQAWVHGDLNGANIVIDGRRNVWLIDFFHAHRGHVLRDLLKLENDLLYIFTPLAPEQLPAALGLVRALTSLPTLDAALPDAAALGVSAPGLVRAWETVRLLRALGRGLVREDREVEQALLGMLRYAVHTLSFDESSPTHKRLALAAAGWCAERLLPP